MKDKNTSKTCQDCEICKCHCDCHSTPEPTKPFCGDCDHYHNVDEKHGICEICPTPEPKEWSCKWCGGSNTKPPLFGEPEEPKVIPVICKCNE